MTMSWLIASLFFLSASAAVRASVTTPTWTWAKSGLPWDSPVPATVMEGGRAPARSDVCAIAETAVKTAITRTTKADHFFMMTPLRKIFRTVPVRL